MTDDLEEPMTTAVPADAEAEAAPDIVDPDAPEPEPEADAADDAEDQPADGK